MKQSRVLDFGPVQEALLALPPGAPDSHLQCSTRTRVMGTRPCAARICGGGGKRTRNLSQLSWGHSCPCHAISLHHHHSGQQMNNRGRGLLPSPCLLSSQHKEAFVVYGDTDVVLQRAAALPLRNTKHSRAPRPDLILVIRDHGPKSGRQDTHAAKGDFPGTTHSFASVFPVPSSHCLRKALGFPPAKQTPTQASILGSALRLAAPFPASLKRILQLTPRAYPEEEGRSGLHELRLALVPGCGSEFTRLRSVY